ncbi:MAG: HemK/PrmC family methyltransferase [Nitrospirota bacterium]
MKALDKMRDISRILAASGIEAADKDAEILIRQGLGLKLSGLFMDNPELTDQQVVTIDAMVSRRKNREPLQYIIGYCEFMGLKILVGSGILVPRPETELMAEQAIKICRGGVTPPLKGNKPPPSPSLTKGGIGGVMILDLCTGSGCLALSLAKEFPDDHVYATDISEIALDYAKRNAVLNEIGNVEFLRGHLFDPLLIEENINPPTSPFAKGGLDSPLSRGERAVSPSLTKRGWAPVAGKYCNGKWRFFNQNKFDLIISNPPYIRTDDIKTLQPEIREWEPIGALDGGADGMIFYREIIPQAGKFLKTNGILMLELGAGCADEAENMMNDAGYTDITVRKDYAGIERTIQARWTN